MSTALKQIMKKLDQKSRELQAEGKAAGQKLEKGLRVLIKRDEIGATLAIARDNVWPSDREWKTVLESLPYCVPYITPTRKSRGLRFYLMARIPDEQQSRLFDLADHG